MVTAVAETLAGSEVVAVSSTGFQVGVVSECCWGQWGQQCEVFLEEELCVRVAWFVRRAHIHHNSGWDAVLGWVFVLDAVPFAKGRATRCPHSRPFFLQDQQQQPARQAGASVGQRALVPAPPPACWVQ